MKTIALKHCVIDWTDKGCITYFEDGTSVESHAHPSDFHYRVISHRTGYQDDVLAYCREHDFAHAFVEQELHDRPSQVLWALAHGKVLNGPQSCYEEFVAQGFQRWLRTNERPILSGVPWDELKAKALELLDG